MAIDATCEHEVGVADSLTWEIDVPLLTTPIVVRQTAFAILIPIVILIAFVGGLAWWDGYTDQIPGILGGMLVIGAGLMFLFALVSLLIFRNRMRMRFHLNDEGVESAVIDATARTGSTLAIAIGLLALKPGIAGSGLLAKSGSIRFVRWKDVRRIGVDERRHTVFLKSKYRVLAALFCTPEVFQNVRAQVAKATGLGETPE
ncbi:hypothetical protein [Roseibium sp.]|uniref:hypothetical protein n=1 Tax=Roseibium sp. TaxID=1936156 RepID=UPI003A974E63